ncbi:MAG: hypothetical protein ACJAUJ_000073 [Salibacteraceae bacterium]|jgi:hypothetical protein
MGFVFITYLLLSLPCRHALLFLLPAFDTTAYRQSLSQRQQSQLHILRPC